ncbi:MAG: methylated-DNA--[protein]-cysteine S-methyltransferase [Mariprofundus sp.]|nr:methylated-DNA--[protein]-cysteine S-methyltransferase [Mariprofundus sp.]
MIYPFRSPFGTLSYAWNGKLCQHIWLEQLKATGGAQDDPVAQWLNAYFNGNTLPLPPLGKPTTPFQARMRVELLAIPAGKVCTYGDLAGKLGTSPRAMGQALGANPLPILIPCHRVVAANGLGGFSCGIDWKKKLLQFEKALQPWP